MIIFCCFAENVHFGANRISFLKQHEYLHEYFSYEWLGIFWDRPIMTSWHHEHPQTYVRSGQVAFINEKKVLWAISDNIYLDWKGNLLTALEHLSTFQSKYQKLHINIFFHLWKKLVISQRLTLSVDECDHEALKRLYVWCMVKKEHQNRLTTYICIMHVREKKWFLADDRIKILWK